MSLLLLIIFGTIFVTETLKKKSELGSNKGSGGHNNKHSKWPPEWPVSVLGPVWVDMIA